MRKFVFSLVLGLLTCVVALAQKHSNTDVVTLKNGSVIKGLIIEQIPGKSIKLKTFDGSVFTFLTSEIDKFGKEEVIGNRNFPNTSKSQVFDKRSGYIGASLGVASAPYVSSGLDGKLERLTGLQLNFLDFGYLFTENIGLTAKFGGKGFSKESMSLGIGYLMLGPLVSWEVSSTSRFELKPMFGLGYMETEITKEGRTRYVSSRYDSYEDKTTVKVKDKSDTLFAYGLEFQYRQHISNNVDWFSVIDYNIAPFNTFSARVGIAFRLK